MADLFPALPPSKFMGLLSVWSQDTWAPPCCRALKLSLLHLFPSDLLSIDCKDPELTRIWGDL